MVTEQPSADPRATVVATPYRLARATALVLSLFLAGAAGYRGAQGDDWRARPAPPGPLPTAPR